MRLRDYITYTHWLQGSIDLQLGRYKDARDQAQMGLALAREHGARNCVCKDLLLLGCLELAQGTPAMAYQFLTEGADTFRRIGGHWDDRCRTQVSLAQATHALGDAARAGQHLCLALEIAVESGAVPLLLWALPAMALLLAGKGKSKRAVELYALPPPIHSWPSPLGSRMSWGTCLLRSLPGYQLNESPCCRSMSGTGSACQPSGVAERAIHPPPRPSADARVRSRASAPQRL